MAQLQVCLSPALIPLYNLTNTVVVVTDVLRASTTIISAFDVGVKEVLPIAHREEAKSYIGKPNYLVAGERDGKKVEGFDLGNSPLLLKNYKEKLSGNTLVITTTNGTKAISASEGADSIYIGALTNLTALATHLKKQEKDILIVCAGWKNRVNLEDTLFAGALADALHDKFEVYGDAAIMSQQLFQFHKDKLKVSIREATHYKRLRSHGIEEDINYCMTIDVSTVVPKLNGNRIVREV